MSNLDPPSRVETTVVDWDRVAEPWVGNADCGLWRRYCDTLGAQLVADLVGAGRARRALKTDLFDEAAGPGLVRAIAATAEEVHGVDVAPGVVDAAVRRQPGLHGAVADVRALPYPDAHFDLVVSTSTLDHLPDVHEFRLALAELGRVVMPGGRLLITLDNRANPVVALRGRLPHAPLARLRLAPFFVGMAVTRAELRSHLQAAGFAVTSEQTAMHAPRVPAVWACALADRVSVGSGRAQRLIDGLIACEALGRYRTRARTGYYVAAMAIRQPAGGT